MKNILNNRKILIISISVVFSLLIVLLSLYFLLDKTSSDTINTNNTSVSNNESFIGNNANDNHIVDNELLNNEILPENEINKLILNKSKIILNLQDEKEKVLELIIKPKNGSVTWVSFNEAIATVDKDGKVTAISEGETTVIAICGELSASCIVEVKTVKDDEQDINIEIEEVIEEENIDIIEDSSDENSTASNPISVEKDYLYVKNKNINLNLKNRKEEKIDYSTNINKPVYFASTNKNVATVDKNGNVSAKRSWQCENNSILFK